MTATPRIFSTKDRQKGRGRGCGSFFPCLMRSNTARSFTGSISGMRSIGVFWAITKWWLLLWPTKRSPTWSTRRPRPDRIGESSAKPGSPELRQADRFLKAMSKYGIKHTISFHSRVAYAKAFSDQEEQGIESVNRLVKQTNNSQPDIRSFHCEWRVVCGRTCDDH